MAIYIQKGMEDIMDDFIETHIGTISCIIMGISNALIVIPFAIWKGKAAVLISGFNSIPKEERNKYDTDKMSKDMLNSMTILTLIWIVGAVLSLLNQYFTILVLVVCLIIFLKDVHLDNEKAFGKYKK
ncbi:MAG: hypothetical protein K0S01_3466 [Herbinix sp.]|jgi:hypothetical protein|nr:hypothetical protein [Herbinix sp.]